MHFALFGGGGKYASGGNLGRWREMTSVSRAETIQRRKLELRGAQVYQVGGLLHLAIVDLYSENYGRERDDRAHVVVDFPAVFLIFLTFGFVMKHSRKIQIQKYGEWR